MTVLIADIETDGLLPTLTKIHCIVLQDHDTKEINSYHGDDGIAEAVARLLAADYYVFHNGVGFDLKAIKKVTGVDLPRDKLSDTLVMSRVLEPQRKSHSLKTWGEDLGFPKGDHKDWSKFSPEMEAYCIRDVEVTSKVFDVLLEKLAPFVMR